MTTSNHRKSEYNVDPIFLDRWSPRAFDGSTMPKEDLLTILDAAHWAPSAFNYQPWRFVYALKGTPEFDKFLDILIEFNQGWAKNASAVSNGQVALDAGEFEEGMKTAQAIGDDTLQRRSGGRVSPESFTHGSSAQRVEWLQRGYQSGDPAACDTFSGA